MIELTMENNKEDENLCKRIYIRRDKDTKTTTAISTGYLGKNTDDDVKKKFSWHNSSSAITFSHYFNLCILGLVTWGLLWVAFGEDWRWDGPWSRLSAVAVIAWGSGQLLHGLTTLPPLLAALLTGIFARNFGFLDMRDFTEIDAFLRKIYPVLILGKGSLAWDLSYMRQNWKQVASLGVLPWSIEVLTMTICTNQLLGFPWTWGILLGSVYASVSCPVIMPSVAKIGARGGRNWPQLICTAGGTDTALSVGVYGLVFSYMFSEAEDIHRYVKAALTLLAGVALGVAWGVVAGRAPHPRGYYVTEIRVLFVLLGGLFANFFTAHIGWGGTGGVAVLACNATAAMYWARDGWKLNNNPASTAYRVLWAIGDPLVFAYTGTFFVLNAATGRTLLYGLAILFICLTVRLATAACVCWDMSLKEKIFVCCAWTPKSIVEAVLGPVAINSLLMTTNTQLEMGYAEDLLRLLVEAILITTPIGFLLTHYLGPWLLKEKSENDNDLTVEHRRKSNVSQTEDSRL